MTSCSKRAILHSTLLLVAILASPVALLAAPEGDGHGEEAKAVVPPTLWAIVSFLVVLFILWKKVLPRILGAMDKRAQAIREALTAAERAKVEAEEMIARHQADLEAARREARAIIEEGKADAERVRAQIVEDARRESREISERAKREIQLAKQSALRDLHQEAVELSFGLASDLIQKNLDPKDHQELIDARIRSFQTSGPAAPARRGRSA
jgi:F-type H+-transporting ATPase subunit b